MQNLTNQVANQEEITGELKSDEIPNLYQEVVWYGQDVNSLQNREYANQLRIIFKVVTFTDWEEACKYLKTSKTSVQVIVSDIDEKFFVNNIVGIKQITRIYIFGANVNYQQPWTENYQNLLFIGNNIQELFSVILDNRNVGLSSHTAMNQMNTTQIRHFEDKEFIDNRERMLPSFLESTKARYTFERNIQESLTKELKFLNDEDIIIVDDVDQVAKLFAEEVLWYGSDVNSEENIKYATRLGNDCILKTFADWKEFSAYLETLKKSAQLITSHIDEEFFVKNIADKQNISKIYIFNNDANDQQVWTKNYKRIVDVQNDFEDLAARILCNKNRKDLPSFAPIFNDMDKSNINDQHFYLRGLTNFKNREQARRDFLALTERVYKFEKKNIEEFKNSYYDYSAEQVLNWYTKDTFFHKTINNSLRIATSDSILYCRLILKDLEAAIKEQYYKENQPFNGLLYRGAHLSDEEWKKLEQNIGKDIEMYGFLSTTKNCQIAKIFAKNAFITILVLPAIVKEEQGFVDMETLSKFQDEKEILFNVRSRFKILEATLEEINGKKIRHLILLYGAHTLGKLIRIKKPIFKLNLVDIPEDKIAQNYMLFQNLKQDHPVCGNCLEKYQTKNKSALLCTKYTQKNMYFEIEGICLDYKETLEIPFYGYKCTKCKSSRPKKCYKCITCKNMDLKWCQKCFENDKSCFDQGHVIILECNPFSFWTEAISEQELEHLKYQNRLFNSYKDVFVHGNIFFAVQDFKKSAKYYKTCLNQLCELNKEDVALLYQNLGGVYNDWGKHQKAIEFYSKSLEINISIYGNNDPNTANLYNRLGGSYLDLGKYDKATELCSKSLEIMKSLNKHVHRETALSYINLGRIYSGLDKHNESLEYFKKSLEITKAIYGENHEDTALSYNNVGSAYYALRDFQKAIEFYSKSLEITRLLYGDKNSQTATGYTNVGNAYIDLSEYLKAFEFCSKSLEIKKLLFGENHPDTASSYLVLGRVYYYLGDIHKSIELELKSLEIMKLIFGEKHQKTLFVYSHLGYGYETLGEYEKALEFYSKTLEITKILFGVKHKKTINLSKDIGNIYISLGNYEKALEFHSKCLDNSIFNSGDKDYYTGLSYNNLAITYHNLKEYHKAIEFYNKALEIYEVLVEANNEAITGIYVNLGSVYKELGENQKAKEVCSKYLKITQSIYDEKHLNTVDAWENLGKVYNCLGEYQKAIDCYSKSYELAKSTYGNSHPTTMREYRIYWDEWLRYKKLVFFTSYFNLLMWKSYKGMYTHKL